jgi:protein-tyrosine phosphatase
LMWQITERLFLGDRDDARDLKLLKDRRLTHVLNCAEEEACHFHGSLRYLHLRMKDPDEAFERLIPRACDFIDEGRTVGGVLVHCSAGVSRSAATVLAWLVCRGRMELNKAAEFLSSRVLTNPDPSFLRQLGRHRGLTLDNEECRRLADVLLGHGASP